MAAEAAAATDAAELSPGALAPGDGSATDRDLEDLVTPACLLLSLDTTFKARHDSRYTHLV